MEKTKKDCPICGEPTLVEKTGEFHFDPPENIPGGTMIIPNSKWEECESCKEVILLPQLIRNLDKQKNKRIIKKIKEWQESDYVHQLTCGSGSCNHVILDPIEENDIVILKCPECDYIQTFIPECVLKADVKEIEKNLKDVYET